ncbi:Fic family protein [Candidatus Sneabacter namystus]|nr:Fic family protein [Candidatus Sneabacter namystus]
MYSELIKKKEQLDSLRPISPAILDNLREWFVVELSYTNTAIDGNTFTRQETNLLVMNDITIGGKTLTEHLEIKDYANAIDFVNDQARNRLEDITEKDILDLHHKILLSTGRSNAGKYRTIPVRLCGSVVTFPNPTRVQGLVKELVEYISGSQDHPITIALEAHSRLLSIRPFLRGNGRVARLLMNMILMMNGYPPAIVRKEDRMEYIDCLEKAQYAGAKESYVEFMSVCISRSLDIYIKAASTNALDDNSV